MRKYLKYVLCLCLLFMLCGCTEEEKKMNYSTEKLNGKTIYNIENKKYIESEEATNYIKIDVNNYGIMIAELYPKVAPITVENIKELIKAKFYDGIIFHRVIKDFMIQTGDPTGTGMGGNEKEIKGEFEINGIKNNISHTRGVLSMARRGSNPETEDTLNSASSQFFIVHQDSNFLDGSYASFGKLLNGYDILDKIATTSTDQNDKPLNDIKMNSIRFVTLYEE
ncbi:MAG: peptidylprolyl isomerase [Bacilli bacterium]